MRLRHYFTVLLCLVAGIATAANKSKDKETSREEPINIRFAWWKMPQNIPELYIVAGNEKLPVSAYEMAMSNSLKFNAQNTVEVVRKVASNEVGKDGKPVYNYIPFITINLEEIKSREIAVLLFPNEAKETYQFKLFDFSNDAFPAGSFYLINYTKAKLDCNVDGKNFSAMPGQRTQCPTIFNERVAAFVAINVTEPDDAKKLIVSTKLIFSKYFRKLYFVTEKKVNDRKEYIVQCIEVASVLPKTDQSNSGDTSDTKKNKSSNEKKITKQDA